MPLMGTWKIGFVPDSRNYQLHHNATRHVTSNKHLRLSRTDDLSDHGDKSFTRSIDHGCDRREEKADTASSMNCFSECHGVHPQWSVGQLVNR